MDYSAVYLQQMVSAAANKQSVSRKTDTQRDDGEFARLMKKNSENKNETDIKDVKPETGANNSTDSKVPDQPLDELSDQALFQAAGLLLSQMTGQFIMPETVAAPLQTEPVVEGVVEADKSTLDVAGQLADENSLMGQEKVSADDGERKPDSGTASFNLERPGAVRGEPMEGRPAGVSKETESADQPLQNDGHDTAKPDQSSQVVITREPASSQETSGAPKAENEPSSDKKDKQSGSMEAMQAAGGQVKAEPSKDVGIKKMSIGNEKVFAPAEMNEPVPMDQLKDHLLDAMNSGKKELEIQLEPENLGRLAVKISQDGGHTTVSIICSENRTHQMLSEHAREMGAIMEDNLGKPTQIVVDQQHTSDYLEQQTRQDGQEKGGQEENGKHKKQNQNQYSVDFVQKLRMGLADAGEIRTLNWQEE